MKCEAMSGALFADDRQELFTSRLRPAGEKECRKKSERVIRRDAMQMLCSCYVRKMT